MSLFQRLLADEIRINERPIFDWDEDKGVR